MLSISRNVRLSVRLYVCPSVRLTVSQSVYSLLRDRLTVFLPMASVLLFASVERCFVYRMRDFSFFHAAFCTVKTRHVLKRAWQGHSTEGYANMNRSWGHDEKVMFLVMIFMIFIMTPQHFPICISFCWKLFPCSFQNRSGFPVAITNKNDCRFKVAHLKFSPCSCMISYQWLYF